VASDSQKIAELRAIVEAVRDRVRARYPEPSANGVPDSAATASSAPRIRVPLSDLMPLVHARDAAQAKIAAIGSVNPRAGGAVNRLIQAVKKTIARSLQWFVRDQISFNREAVAAIEATIEALNDHNRAFVELAAKTNESLTALAAQSDASIAAVHHALAALREDLRQELGPMQQDAAELKDMRSLWPAWRTEWDQKVATNEIQFLRSVADLQGAFQHRATLMESNFREIVKAQHADYLGALDRANIDIQKRLWADLEKVRDEYSRLIHDELRVIRLRRSIPVAPAPPAVQTTAAVQGSAPAAPDLDYTRFAHRFRGPEEVVRRTEEFYRPYFAQCHNVLDIGCGRGEFLELMREMNVPARGIDLGDESVAQCRDKGLDAEAADLFTFLGPNTAGEFDGIFASQLVEHIDPARLPEMIRLCASSLRRGGVIAIETPNPRCLAIFATYFYLDPTHTRPVPHPLMQFYLEESGCGQIEVHELSPAVESMPELAELPESFRKRFFGGLDYAIIARRL
jgi:O-antigen chain-terminating methyltransferase